MVELGPRAPLTGEKSSLNRLFSNRPYKKSQRLYSTCELITAQQKQYD